jgi:uncharacterized membrane protein YfcA
VGVDWQVVLVVMALAAVASLIQALSGFGFSLFIVPFLAMVIGPKETVALANLLATAVNLTQVPAVGRAAEAGMTARLVAGCYLGMPLGLAVLLVVEPEALQVGIAVCVLGFTALLASGWQLRQAGLRWDVGTGFVSGLLNTSTSMSGPPVVLYLQGRRLAPLAFRGTTTVYFLATSGGAAAMLFASGLLTWGTALLALAAFPASQVGRLAGNRLFRLFDERRFRWLVFAILVVSASAALGNALV